MATSLTTTSYALLALLHVRAWSTYELTQQVRRSLHWFWPAAERRLYAEPKRLVAAGLATATNEPTGKRRRTVYTITEEGRSVLRNWLSAPAAPRTTESEAILKVFFADAGTRDQLLATLEQVAAEAGDRLEELAGFAGAPIEDVTFPHRQHINALTLHLAVEQHVAELRWARWAHEQVLTWPATTEPGRWATAAALANVQRRALAAREDPG